MTKVIILNRLLDKYESSKHLMEPGVSNRRVMLRIASGKKEFPEYDYQDASIRDTFNDAATALEKEGFVTNEWVKDRPVLSCVSLNLNKVKECYSLVGRTHPKELAAKVASTVLEKLSHVSTQWIVSWRDDICTEAQRNFRVPSYCKNDFQSLLDLLTAFKVYDSMHGESITMRAFSSQCYHDTKYFERCVRERFLRIAQTYDTGLAQASEEGELGIRDQLAYLGIYARPELYELSGSGVIHTATGSIDLGAAGPYGIALPSTAVDYIAEIDLNQTQKITFIENKTNYDEYILSERCKEELVVDHGGFLSPQKKKLFAKIGAALHADCEVSFWADIDLGGFQMYSQLQQMILKTLPMRLSGQDVTAHHMNGLVRSTKYLEKIKAALVNQEYPIFEDAMERILEYGVTIEQEDLLQSVIGSDSIILKEG